MQRKVRKPRPKKYDATLKNLIERYPADWLRSLGLPVSGQVEVLDTDLSTITTQADRVLRLPHPDPHLIHIELQSSLDRRLVSRILQYNVLLYVRYSIPVFSIAILLRPQADDASLTGMLRYAAPDGNNALTFHYQVVRVWQVPLETVLQSGPGALPLVPLCEVSRESLPIAIQRMEERIHAETKPEEAKTLLTSAYLLAGLRFSKQFIDELFTGVAGMKESTTYRAILREGLAEGRAKGLEEGRAKGRTEGRAEGRAEGAVAEARKILLRLGEKRFGSPTAAVFQTVSALNSLERLEELHLRVLEVSDWEELLR